MSEENATMTREQEYEARAQVQRERVIRAMRDCADFLEQNPTVPTPTNTVMNVWVHSKNELAKIARVGRWEKEHIDRYFVLKNDFDSDGDFRLEMNIGREEVCEKIVTGTRTIPARPAQPERQEEIVEWHCKPLLGDDEDAS